MKYLYLKEFIDDLQSNGRYSFTLKDVRTHFEQADGTIKNKLRRLKLKREIAQVRKEFYVIVTPEYRSKGMIPPSLFISDLMSFLGKDYYVGALSAAALYGAAHQQPQTFSVITIKPALRDIRTNNLAINFLLKQNWSKQDIIQKKVDTGYILLSSPELTALDLVYYFDQSGGFNRIATILDELSESINGKNLAEAAKEFNQVTTVQRLGYLLDEVLQRKELSISLLEYLKTVNHFPVLLRPGKEKYENMITGNVWKVVRNIDIETDL